MELNFEWNEAKAQINLKKHKVTFEEAKTVFNDPFAITISDPLHSVAENRFIDIGYSIKGRYIVVVYTERRGSIRIISCRKATKEERNLYEEN